MPGPPLIIPSSSTGTGTSPTLPQSRNRLADELGFRLSTIVSDTGDNGDAARVVIADELRDDEMAEAQMPWLYVNDGVSAGIQRRLVSQPGVGYQGNLGAVVLSRPFSASLTAGTNITLTAPLPVKRHLGVLGLDDCINQALALIWVPARLTLTGNGTYTYDLSAYPWLDLADLQTRGVYDSMAWGLAFPSQLSPYTARIVSNGAARTLTVDVLYSTADTFYLDVVVRADVLIYDGTAWAYATTPGLLGDAYQTAAPAQWVHVFAMMKSLQQQRKMLQMRPNPDPKLHAYTVAEVQQRINTWAMAAVKIIREQFPKKLADRTEPMVTPGAGFWSTYV